MSLRGMMLMMSLKMIMRSLRIIMMLCLRMWMMMLTLIWIKFIVQVEEDRATEVYQFPPPNKCPCRKANKIKDNLELISHRLCSLLVAEETHESLSDATAGVNDVTEEVNSLAEMLRLEVSIQIPESAGRSAPYLAEQAWSLVSQNEADHITFVKDCVSSLNDLIPSLLSVASCYCPSSNETASSNGKIDRDILSMVANMSTGNKVATNFTTEHEQHDDDDDDDDIMKLVSGMVQAEEESSKEDEDILSLVSGMVADIDEDSGKFEPPVDSRQACSIAQIGRQTLERARKRKQKSPMRHRTPPKMSPNSRKKARMEAEALITMRDRRPFQENRATNVLRMLESKRKNSKHDGLCQFVLR